MNKEKYLNTTSNNETEIHALIEKWSKAVRDRNLAGIRADHDPNMLMFDVPPPSQIRGLDAYMATWKLFFDWSAKPIAFDLQEVKIAAGSDVAFASAIGHCRGKERSGEIIQLQFRLTMGFRKRNEHWSIVHEHHSVPSTD